MKKLRVVVVLGLVWLGFALAWGEEVVEEIVAIVNDDIITLSDYKNQHEALYQMLRAQFQGEEFQQHYRHERKKLLEMMINNKKENCVLVNKKIKLPEKDFKAVIENERVKKIGTEFFGKNAFACFPMYKFSREDFLLWLDECEKYIMKGRVNIYAENVFNEISNMMLLYPLYFDGEVCMEIDTKEDIEKANRILITKDF